MRKLIFAVVGAGNGGLAMAGHLAQMGYGVRLYNRNAERLRPVRAAGGIRLEGALRGFGRVNVAGDPETALAGADAVMVVVPASGHRQVARLLAPHLRDGQVIVLHPGRTLGAIEFAHALRTSGCEADVTVAEAQTLLYASRVVGPATVRVFQVKRRIPLAALPARRTPEVLERVRRALPMFEPATNVLQTGLENIGAVFHPGPALLNLARLEEGAPWEFYRQGITAGVARVLDAVDAERLEVARALGVEAAGARRWLEEAYGIDCSGDLSAAIRANPAYRGIPAPSGLDTRYLSEDVPTGLVPLASLGEFLEVPTPVINSLITLASLATGTDYRASGRTLERVGLGGMSVADIHAYVIEGREPVCRIA